MAAANGVRSVWVGQNGLLSTPAVSAVIRERVGKDVSNLASTIYILLYVLLRRRTSPHPPSFIFKYCLLAVRNRLRTTKIMNLYMYYIKSGNQGIRSIYTDSKSQSRWSQRGIHKLCNFLVFLF